MSDLVYLNGAFLPRDEACVPVMDRGFLFGDGVYEVIPAYGGVPFRMDAHLARLGRSLAAIRLAPPLSPDEWSAILKRLLAQWPGQDQQVYLQVTRGVATERNHAIPAGINPTIMAWVSLLPKIDSVRLDQGISAVTVPDIRWQRCDIKAITLLANVLCHQQARDEDAQEAILVRDGLAMEGSASNLFVVVDGVLSTPPNSQHLLPGVTRDLVLELAAAHGMAHSQQDIPVAWLESAEEIWLTSSTREIMCVTRLNGRPVANGMPGSMWRKMIKLFADCKLRLRTESSGHCQ